MANTDRLKSGKAATAATVPPALAAALRKDPADTTIRLGIADWWGENDRPDLAAAWTWFAATGKTPVRLTLDLCRKVDKELGHAVGAGSGYTVHYMTVRSRPVWNWLGAGWGGTSVAHAALGRAVGLASVVARHTDPVVSIASLVAARLFGPGSSRGADVQKWTDALRADAPPEEPFYETVHYPKETHNRLATRGEIFDRIRRLGGDRIVIEFGGGHDEGGVRSMALWFGGDSGAGLGGAPEMREDDDPVTRAMTTPIYDRYSGFDGDVEIDGTLVWDADTGSAVLSATETQTVYDNDGNEESQDEDLVNEEV